jgi:hypothetical protein
VEGKSIGVVDPRNFDMYWWPLSVSTPVTMVVEPAETGWVGTDGT